MGGISWHHKSSLKVVENTMISPYYRDNILDSVVVPFGLQSVGSCFIFQDDNARPHREKIITYFHENNIDYVHME